MYTSRKVRRAVEDLSDEDFTMLLDDLNPEARAVVEEDAGRLAHAVALTRHYDDTRSLGALVDMIREIMPNANL